MPRMHLGRPGVRSVAVLLLVVTCALVAVAPAFAKDYSMGPVVIDARVQPDGSLLVTEDRTYGFDGDFTFVYWTLNKKSSAQIEILGLEGPEGAYERTGASSAVEQRPPGMYLVTDYGDAIEARAFFRHSNEDVTFRLTYRVTGAANRWDDTGELYWQFIGDEWEKGASDISISVTLPNPGETVTPGSDVRAWIHGPLTGSFDVGTDGQIAAQLGELEPYTFVEVRTLFPTDWLLPTAASRPGMRVDDVLAEEAGWADEANRKRDAAIAREKTMETVRTTSLIGSPVLSLAALALGIWLFLRYGREYKTQFQGQYFREKPDDTPPALVGSLMRMGTVEDSDIAATLMSLANQGVIQMRPVTVSKKGGFLGTGKKQVQTFELRLDRSRLDSAHVLERTLATMLFSRIKRGTDAFTIEDLKAYAKAYAESFSSAIKDWKSKVGDEATKRGFFEDSGTWAQIGMIGLAVVVAIIGIGGTVLSRNAIPAALGVPVAIAVGAMGFFGSRRSPDANELFAKYSALKNYLRDFSRLNEAPPMHVKLWEDFLVLAVVFGIAKEVIDQMRVRIPDVVSDPHFQTTYWWVYSAGSYNDSPVGALQSGFASAASIASSEMSSSSGGGGGFSGG